MEVKVRFVFDSPIEGVKKIGFITPPSETSENLFMKNFKTTVNNKTTESRVEPFNKSPFKTNAELKKLEKVREHEYSYVYHFDASLKKGENVIEHTYTYTGSAGVNGEDYYYVITTISKWKNKRVNDFELIVDMVENSLFTVPYTFWKDGKKIDWKLVGDGKTITVKEENNKLTMVSMKKGYLKFNANNFNPDYDVSIMKPTLLAAITLFDVEKNEKLSLRDKLTDTYIQGYHLDMYSFNDDELRIIKNYPYALEGYDFSDIELKKYFSKFIWYTPISKNVSLDRDELKEVENFQKKVQFGKNEVKKYLNENLEKYSKEELSYIKKLPYAIRGFEFEDKALDRYYKNKSWYKVKGETEINLTRDETELINKINKIMK